MLNVILLTGVIVALTLLIVTSLSRSSEVTLPVRDRYSHPYRVNADPMFGVREVCRSVLNANTFRFVAANAPAEVVSSFGTQQQRLARFSLQVAHAMLVQRLARDLRSWRSFSRSLKSSMSRFRNAFLLGVCTIGRVGLGILRGLSGAIPAPIQIRVSASILSNVGGLLIDTVRDEQSISKNLRDERVLCRSARLFDAGSSQSAVTEDIMRALRISLPNDLSRLIFLAILRDNNTGHYHHPQVAHRFPEKVADRAMLACHRQIYEQVVALSLEDLTEQLDTYMATVRVAKERLIENWTKLQAYRASIPMDTDPISAEMFFMKIGVAVAILEARLPISVR